MPSERTFLQYVNLAGGTPVRDWYDKLEDDFRGKLEGRIDFCSKLPKVKPPHFKKIEGDLWEVRVSIKRQTVRIYMTPAPSGPNYIFLVGDIKKRKSISKAIKKLALSRIKEIENGDATTCIWNA